MYYFIVNETGGSGKAKAIWFKIKKEIDERG